MKLILLLALLTTSFQSFAVEKCSYIYEGSLDAKILEKLMDSLEDRGYFKKADGTKESDAELRISAWAEQNRLVFGKAKRIRFQVVELASEEVTYKRSYSTHSERRLGINFKHWKGILNYLLKELPNCQKI